jgi:hypothetical protein
MAAGAKDLKKKPDYFPCTAPASGAAQRGKPHPKEF